MFAGVGGVLIGPITYSNPYIGDTYGIAGFVALMIGGTERPVAAMAGGLMLGVLGETSEEPDQHAGVRLVPVRRRRRDPASRSRRASSRSAGACGASPRACAPARRRRERGEPLRHAAPAAARALAALERPRSSPRSRAISRSRTGWPTARSTCRASSSSPRCSASSPSASTSSPASRGSTRSVTPACSRSAPTRRRSSTTTTTGTCRCCCPSSIARGRPRRARARALSLRVSGLYFAITTFIFTLVVTVVASDFAFTGGYGGLVGPIFPGSRAPRVGSAHR